MINSDSYWNTRFENDWETFQGPSQSRFFARLAIEQLPSWLIEQLQRHSLTLVDWGCAQGDGTDVWVSYMDARRIAGVDFSSVAIELAAKRYPSIHFYHEDWLLDGSLEQAQFDVVFSSNTLEHFYSPFSVLDVLAARATKAVVLALPYRELDRHPEHFFTFLPDNIPIKISNDFRLVWSKVVDCQVMSNALWNGEQIILVYAKSCWYDALALKLRHSVLEQTSFDSELSRLKKILFDRESQINSIQKDMSEREEQLGYRNQELSERVEQLGSLEQSLVQTQSQLSDLTFESSRLRMQLIALSDWASGIDQHPLRYAFRKSAIGIARKSLRSMPLSNRVKQHLRELFFSYLRPLRQSVCSRESASLPLSDDSGSMRISIPSQCELRDVFVFAVIDWHFRMQRPQHIARSLSERGHRVFYFSNHFIDADEPGYELEKLPGTAALYQIKLHVRGAPAIYFDPPSEAVLELLTLSMTRFMLDFVSLSSYSIIQHAYWYPLVQRLPNSYRIYDCMDHHEGFGNVPTKLIDIESAMLGSADLVTVTSSWLEGFAHQYNQNVALVRNAAEYTHFVSQPQRVYLDEQGRRIIGYYGAIAEWFDLEIVRSIAQEYSDCLILLVGDDTTDARKQLAEYSNVSFTGEVSYDKLPYYLHAFDVCLLPFKVIPLTLATNPVKVYEYLSAGKPVVCVDLPEIEQFGHLVWRAASLQEFVKFVGAALQESGHDAHKNAEDRRLFAAEQTWHHRGVELITALNAIRMPRISVIILTYNNLELTRVCMESVLQRSEYPNLEVIVVDNASSDRTPAYLKDLEHHHPEVRVILNNHNSGFAAGNNLGLSTATGDYLVLLNNDTVVTRGWVMTLFRHFQNDTTLGIVGPVTNNIGNEARIETAYQEIQAMPSEIIHYTLAHMGQAYPMRTAAFFCVIFPRSVYEYCGPICEDYGRGFFEDDDYCRRVEVMGKRIVCADDVFVHHHLSASFNRLKDSEKQDLFLKNKQVYESKWGTWTPHTYRKRG